MNKLLQEIRNCNICDQHLEFGVNPIISASTGSKIVIIGQAPGRLVHSTNIPWNDKSGETLRNWLAVDKTTFYNKKLIALMPMGFCYPGSGKSGDLRPRPECAPMWHAKLLAKMTGAELIILVGQYAQNYYLKNNPKNSLTESVRNSKNIYRNILFYPILHPETISGKQKTNGL